MKRRFVVLTGCVLLAATIATTLGRATAPAKDGRIVFIRFHLSNTLTSEVYVVNTDGTGARRLSHPPVGYTDNDPDWAPDGSRIIFERHFPNDDGPHKIWSVKLDGSDERRLSPDPATGWPEDTSPAFSPDGRHIAFVRYYGGPAPFDRLMVADSNLQHARPVYQFGIGPGTPNIGCPAWSPDGKRLAFYVANVNGKQFKPVKGEAIFLVGLNGGHLRRLTRWRLRAGCQGLDWSPDGKRILFRANGPFDDSGGNLYTIRPDGTGLRQLTHYDPGDTALGALHLGSYSPDGNSIVFATYHDAVTNGPCCRHPDIFVMSADGTDIRPVTRNPNFERDPDWGSK